MDMFLLSIQAVL